MAPSRKPWDWGNDSRGSGNKGWSSGSWPDGPERRGSPAASRREDPENPQGWGQKRDKFDQATNQLLATQQWANEAIQTEVNRAYHDRVGACKCPECHSPYVAPIVSMLTDQKQVRVGYCKNPCCKFMVQFMNDRHGCRIPGKELHMEQARCVRELKIWLKWRGLYTEWWISLIGDWSNGAEPCTSKEWIMAVCQHEDESTIGPRAKEHRVREIELLLTDKRLLVERAGDGQRAGTLSVTGGEDMGVKLAASLMYTMGYEEMKPCPSKYQGPTLVPFFQSKYPEERPSEWTTSVQQPPLPPEEVSRHRLERPPVAEERPNEGKQQAVADMNQAVVDLEELRYRKSGERLPAFDLPQSRVLREDVKTVKMFWEVAPPDSAS